jgi:phage-related minor tail protein
MALDMAVALRVTAGVTGGQQVEKLTNDLKRMGQQGEISSRQMRQAMSQLPAQFQDIAVSLAGGQSPLMVLLQQGSQITTQFGSVGNALRGVTSFITPATVGFGALAGAIGSVAAAFVAGYTESREFSRAIAVTGNFAGMTADNYNRMAEAISAATGASALASRGFLMGAVQSGSGPQSTEAIARAMAQLQQLSGQTSEEVIKVFANMRDGVSDWAVSTNKMYNFLSVEQYKYIKLLEEQGKADQAAQVAADALTNALGQRTVNLGSLERAWIATKNAASSAWNSMLNIGRETTTQDQIADLEKRLSAVARMRELMQMRGQKVPDDSPELQSLRDQLEALREVERLQQRSSALQAERAAKNQADIKDEIELESERKRVAQEEEQRSRQRAEMLQRLDDEITKLTQGELAYQMVLGMRIGMTDEELTALRERLNAVEALREKERMRTEEEKRATEMRKRKDEESKRLVMDRLKLEQEGKRVYDETRTAVERLAAEETRLAFLLKEKIIDFDTYQRAIFKANEEFDKIEDKGTDVFKELQRAIEGWGKSSADAVADFAMGAKNSFSDLARSIIKDIIQMVAYQTLTKPLFGAIGGMFASGPGFGAIPGFANGGIMGPSGDMPLKRYARGGIATSPQVALFGEGSMPEAYVPLPDGRSIPVTMQGGGGDVVVNVNVESGSTTVQSNDGAGQLGRIIAGVVKAELINQKRPGGLLAAA